jgi:hypothetical protein
MSAQPGRCDASAFSARHAPIEKAAHFSLQLPPTATTQSAV